MKKMTASIAALAIVAAMATASGSQRAAAQDVKIGVVMATTGTFAFVGAPLVNGIKLANDELAASNFFGSTKVTFLFEHNRSDKQEAIALINRMATSDNAVMVIGPVSSGEAQAAAPAAVDLKIPIFTTATDPGVLKAGPWIFKSTEIAENYMGHLGEVIAKQVKPSACFVVTIRDNEGYVRQSNVFRDTIKAGGVKIAGEESIVAADSDFSALSTKIASSGADCLFMSTPPAQGANLVLQVKQAGGLAGKAILVGNTGMTSDQYVKTGGKALDNTYIPADFLPTGVNDLARSFIDKYTKTYNTAPDGWAAIGYSMTRVVANAIKNAGANITRESLRDAMMKTKDVPVAIGDGTFTIDADRVPHYGTAVIVLRDGKWGKP